MLRDQTAAMLAEHLDLKMPHHKAFNVPTHTADMIRMDLKTAGIDYLDDQGRNFDFHALRHTFVTNIANSGASVRTTQELARHSTPTLTIGRYAHSDDNDKLAAIRALPDIRPLDEVAEATGTDDSKPVSAAPSAAPN